MWHRQRHVRRAGYRRRGDRRGQGDDVRGDERPLLEVEHTIEGTSVETHITGTPRHVSLIEASSGRATANIADDVDLSERTHRC
ncbi:hypothetical protein C8039_11575 [Halogeometricum sp. wsp3]|nr:hypothetical protein C8039_11575 [Halogeometricum sp. wsp3]